MNIISTFFLALSMSADAFAVSLGKGAALKKPRLRDAARTGAIFGCVEGIAPLLGWLAGSAASSFIETWDHWIAFGILVLIGMKMIYESFDAGCKVEDAPSVCKTRLCMTIFTAIGTSVDSMAVGVSLAFANVNIWIAAAAIGCATFSMSTLGIMIGHYIGCKCGRVAEALGGTALIIIGTKILFDHLQIL